MKKRRVNKFKLYHRGHLLTECKTAKSAFEKAQLYREWFSGVEVRKVRVS